MTGYMSNKMKQMLLLISQDMPVMPVLFIQDNFRHKPSYGGPNSADCLFWGNLLSHYPPPPPAPVKIYQPGLQIITVVLLRTLYNV